MHPIRGALKFKSCLGAWGQIQAQAAQPKAVTTVASSPNIVSIIIGNYFHAVRFGPRGSLRSFACVGFLGGITAAVLGTFQCMHLVRDNSDFNHEPNIAPSKSSRSKKSQLENGIRSIRGRTDTPISGEFRGSGREFKVEQCVNVVNPQFNFDFNHRPPFHI
ncbi:hypothetical protein B0H17DRAFT_1134689 [Mycena rosella]|uniref:Uncharacterized protein n=1 Tax=Mycena rosella TaxID=1033263 RepID=A0AAD7GGP0_MYCRO|nr:hypothetical protein B0H17DRAFT_1134689 [Mycena rosella]